MTSTLLHSLEEAGLDSEVLRPWRIRLKRLLDENTLPSEGIWYMVRYPTGWDVFVYRFDEDRPTSHARVWVETLVPVLCQLYSVPPSVSLLNCSYLNEAYRGFPRGRVYRTANGFTVEWGGEEIVDKRKVEELFSLVDPEWVIDKHETCIDSHVTIVNRLYEK